jgi:hypothetical protein
VSLIQLPLLAEHAAVSVLYVKVPTVLAAGIPLDPAYAAQEAALSPDGMDVQPGEEQSAVALFVSQDPTLPVHAAVSVVNVKAPTVFTEGIPWVPA